MLSVSTIWLTIIFIFVAVALVWAHLIRSYPDFTPARYWALSALSGAVGALVSSLRMTEPLWISLLIGGVAMIFAGWMMLLGVRSFYGLRSSWREVILNTALAGFGIGLFVYFDNMPARITCYSIGQAIPAALAARLLLSQASRESYPGARLAGFLSIAMVGVYALRSMFALVGVGGSVSIVDFNGVQAALILSIVFFVNALYFALLLMTLSRLRDEVAALALIDDLTGVANRRHLFQRLQLECSKATRTGYPFSVLAIDLDGFKAINDRFGHAAGDDSLRHFTLMVQSRLRPGDLLARIGGDEFYVVLPRATEEDAAQIAGRILDTCRIDAESCRRENEIPVFASIGVAQWTAQIGEHPESMTVAADKAMYRAKTGGRNRMALLSEVNEFEIPQEEALGVA